jgi:AraC-like DNA-binding protein
MTGGVNPLTTRAMGQTAPPTIGSGTVRPLLDALERLGHDGGRLVAAAGLDRGVLDDPDARVPCEAQGALLMLAQRERPRTNLALDLAAVTPIGAYPLIDYLVVSSGTVGEGLTRLARYYRLIEAGASLQLREDGDLVEVRAEYSDPFAVEYAMSITLLHLAREGEGRPRAEYLNFMHRPGDATAYQHALGCPVVVGAPWNGFAMTSATWRLPMRRRDAALLGVLERHADEVMARMPEPGDIVTSTRHAIAQGMALGEATIETIARSLALAPRTLQRRLADTGTTFQRLLEQTRRDAASRHLEQSNLSIGEIAFVLGYSEPAAFHRAFRRWHGVTPQAFRASCVTAHREAPRPS